MAIRDAIQRGPRRQIRLVATPLRREVRRLRHTVAGLRRELIALRATAAVGTDRGADPLVLDGVR